MQRTRGDQYQGKVYVGQRVHSILYGGRDGIISAIHGVQRPETIQNLGGGVIVTGGAASIDVVFDSYISRGIPESIIRGVQWYILNVIENTKTIEAAIKKALQAENLSKQREKEKAERRSREREELPGHYPHLIPASKAGNSSSHALGAKNIKKELLRTFPGVKFSVRSDCFSGGNSIDVSWTDGPTEKEVEKVIGKYQEGHFNGMEDLYEYNRDNVFPDVFGGAKYVHSQRSESKELRTTAAATLGYDLDEENFDKWGNLQGLGWETEQEIYRKAREIRAC
jgi:hypothetical protein